MSKGLRGVTIHTDGGARGNPGPAGAGFVIRTDDDGEVLYEKGLFLGRATCNVAEYRGLLAGLEMAAQLGATEVTVVSDSELLVRQMNGQYRVKAPHLQPLYAEAKHLSKAFEQCTFTHVRRENNTHADRLVNEAIDLRQDVT
jgi:ribonuclease HI